MRMFRGQTQMCPSNEGLSDQLLPSFLRREQGEDLLCVHNTQSIAFDCLLSLYPQFKMTFAV